MAFDIFRNFCKNAYTHIREYVSPKTVTIKKKNASNVYFNPEYVWASDMPYIDYLGKADHLTFFNPRPLSCIEKGLYRDFQEYCLTGTPYILRVYPSLAHSYSKQSTRHYWYCSRPDRKVIPVSFEEVLEGVSEEVAEQLIFHLDLFT